MRLSDPNYKSLFETYHGVKINIEYEVRAEIKRSLLAGGSIVVTSEIYVERKADQKENVGPKSTPHEFAIVPERVKNIGPLKRGREMPSFKIEESIIFDG